MWNFLVFLYNGLKLQCMGAKVESVKKKKKVNLLTFIVIKGKYNLVFVKKKNTVLEFLNTFAFCVGVAMLVHDQSTVQC